MPAQSSTKLSYDTLGSAVSGTAAAFRLRLRLEPAGGSGDKVFPPTYDVAGNAAYATEQRWIDGKQVPCVLLDSVQSQANRMELALQGAWEAGRIKLPVISADFRGVNHPGIRKITSLEAPHRIADAILRDSMLDNARFRNSPVGKKIDTVSLQYATPLFEHCPTALIFGMWDSTGPRGGMGVKFQRALVSEIIGVNAVPGVKTSSRIDPLNIRVNSGPLFKSEQDMWTLDENDAVKEKGKPAKLGKDGKPSEANHGNVTPSIAATGGFTVEYAEQITVLSLPALRRLRFPFAADETADRSVDVVARTYLAALGLLAATLAAETGYDLRSRCVLRATDPIQWHLLGRPGEPEKAFALTGEEAVELLGTALKACEKAKLPFQRDEIVLTPSEDLATLVKKSMELAAAEAGGE